MLYRIIPCLLAALASQTAVAQYENHVSLGGAYVKYDDGRSGSIDMGVGVDLCRGAYCGTLEAMRYINERERVLDAFSVSFVYRY